MAKLPRKTQKIFCSKPTSEKQTSVFGTMKTADKQYSTDVGTLQSNVAYEQGWKSATIASYKPFMEDFNTLNYINTSQLAYLFQQGIPEWDEATTYYKNSFCSYNGDLWQSLIDDNLGNAPFEGNEWTLFTSKNKGGGLELCDIGTALYVDETQGLRRRLNGSILAITNNTQAFLTRLKQIVTLYPSLVCTEDEWQTIKTMSKLGQCGKFVLNYAADGTTVESVRLPAVVNINGLVDMANCGLIKDESLPNLRGNISTVTANIGAADGVFKAEDAATNWNIGNNQQNHFYRASFDASRFSTTYKDSASVQQEAIQYPYFIQVATGQETENNIVNDIELNNPYVLFDNKYVEAPLYNLSWLKSDGEYKPKTTYIKPYEALIVEQNTDIAVGTTVDLPSGTKYTKRGLSVKLSTASDITDYDFVINTTDETFRLPLKNGMEGVFASGVKGNGIGLGLTTGSVKGSLSATGLNANPLSSSLSGYGASVGTTITGVGQSAFADKVLGITTDPEKSGMICDKTVPSGYNLYYYVGETVQNSNLIDAGRIGEILPTKTDAVQASHASMPSDKYVNLTLGATGSTYPAPANGWFYFKRQSDGSQTTLTLQNTAKGYGVEAIASIASPAVILPVAKGDVITVYWINGATSNILRFYYAEGDQ